MIQSLNSKKIASLISYFTLGINLIITIFITPLYIGILGVSKYGLYQLLSSLISYFAIMDFGLSTTVSRFYSIVLTKSNKQEKHNFNFNMLILYFFFILLFSGLFIIFYLNFSKIFSNNLSSSDIELSKFILIILYFSVILNNLSNLFNAIINAHENFFFLKVINLIQVLLQPLFSILLLFFNPFPISLGISLLFISIFILISKFLFLFIFLNERFTFYFIDKSLLIKVFKFSLSIFGVIIFDQIFWRTNQIILGFFYGTTVVSIYSISSLIFLNYMPLSTIIQGIFLPSTTKSIHNKVSSFDLSAQFIRIGRIQFFLLSLVFFGFIIFGYYFITNWFGILFADSYYIAIIIMVPFTIELIQNFGFVIMQATNTYFFRAKLLLPMALLNIIISFYLVKEIGLYGAAISACLILLVSNGIFMNIFYYKILKLDIKKFWREIFLILLPNLIFSSLFYFISSLYSIQNIYDFLLRGILFVFLYFCVQWFFTFTFSEKQTILSLFSFLKKINLFKK
jgi:O-antigen/teichoic acid export membrane protein